MRPGLTAAVALAILTTGCPHGAPSEGEMSTETPATLQRGRAVYRTELLPVASPPAGGAYSPALTLAIMRGNVSPERVVAFDGEALRVDETTVELGWRSRATRIVAGGEELFCKALPLLQFCARGPVAAGPIPTGDEGPMVALLAGERTIAGRRCREAEVEDAVGRWRVWFDPSAAVTGPAAALLTVPGIDGLVCEREALEAPAGAVARRRDTLVELTTQVGADAFVAPAGFERVASPEAAVALSRARIEAMPPGAVVVEGRWRLVSPGPDEVLLTVVHGDDGLTLTRTEGASGRTTRERARLHGGWVVVDGDRVPELYGVDGSGQLVQLNRGVLRYERVMRD